MANGYDGDIKLSVTLSAEDIKSSAQSLSNNIKAIFDKSAGKELDSKFQRLQSSMSKTVSKAQDLQSAMERLENTQVPTEEYREIQQQIDKARDSLVKLIEKQERFIETGGDIKSKTYQGMQYDVEQLKNTIEYAEGELQDLVETGKAFKLGSDSSEYSKLQGQLSETNNQMRILSTSADEYTQKANSANTNTAKLEKSTKKLGTEMKNTSSKTQGFANGLGKAIGKFAMFAIGIRSVFTAFQKIKSAITSGLTSMAMMNGGMNKANSSISQLVSSLNYLKGALASAFLPIVNVVSPILSRLIDQIAQVITAIGMMIAKLTGASSFTKVVKKNTNYAASQSKGSSGKSAQEKYDEAVKKAQEKYDKKVKETEAKNAERMAKAEEKQAKAAAKLAKEQDKANGKLAAFDDLNVLGVDTIEDLEDAEADLLDMPELELPSLEDFKDSGGGGTEDPFGLEEVPLEEFKLDFLDKLKEIFAALLDGFNSTMDKLNVKERFEKLLDYIDRIKKKLKEIFLDNEISEAAKSMIDSFLHFLGSLAADFISIGISIATFIVGGIAQYLEEDDTVQRIKEYLINMFTIGEDIFTQLEEFYNAIANIFTVLETPEALAFSENLVGIFSEAFMNITELAGKFMDDVIYAITQPIIDNQEKIKLALTDMFGQANTVLEGLRNLLDEVGKKFNEVYDEHIGPFVRSVGDGLSEILGFVLDLWENHLKKYIDELVTNLKDLMDNYITPGINQCIQNLGPLVDLLKLLWENVLVPLIEFIATVVVVKFELWITKINAVLDAVKPLFDLWNDFRELLGIFLEFIVDVFTVGWDEAWDNMSEKLTGWVEDVTKYFTIDYWKQWGQNLVDGLGEGINEAWETFKDGAGKVGQKVIELFKKDTDSHSPSRKAKAVGEDVITGFFLPFTEQAVEQSVTPFVEHVLGLIREGLTGASISEIGTELVTSLIEGITQGLPNIETFLMEQFLLLEEMLNEQFNTLFENVLVTGAENLLMWFDEQMQLWWSEHVLIWFSNEKWETDIYKPWETFRDNKWQTLMKWWDEMMKKWWDEKVVPWFKEEKWREQFEHVYKVAKEVGEKTRDKITELADETKEAVLSACESMKEAILEVIALLGEAMSMAAELSASAGGATSGGGGSSGGGGARSGRVSSAIAGRTFMPRLDIMHFEDNLGMSAFKFPELATGAVIPPNREFLAVLGDQRNGMNIETPLATMIEAFRNVMDEYMGGTHQSAVMEVDGETFARLMMPHVMGEMNRLGYNTEIIEGM